MLAHQGNEHAARMLGHLPAANIRVRPTQGWRAGNRAASVDPLSAGAPSVSIRVEAMEEVKTLDVQPRRALRRMGSGMLGQPSVEQGRSHRVAVHRPRQAWYKPVGAKSRPVPGEKSEGDVLLLTARTT